MSDRSGARDADFEEFIREHGRSLQRTAVLLAADRAAGEDLLQTTLAKAYGRWTAVEAADRPVAYVRQMMVNTHLSWLRRLTNGERVTDHIVDRAAPGDLSADHAQRADLHAALRRLSPRVRTAVVLRYFDDLSQADTARLMGCTPSTVNNHVTRGLSQLRQLLADQTPCETERGAR